MFTIKALRAGLISQAEADEIEDWLDENIKAGVSVSVPAKFEDLWDKIVLYNMTANGEKQ